MSSVLPSSTSLLFLLLAVGCPEPPPDVISPSQAPTTASGGSAASPDDPTTTGGRIPPGMRIEPPGFGLEEGEGVKISGTISYEGEIDGQLRVEILQPGEEGDSPQLLHAATLDALGPWFVIAPADLGDIAVVAYLDRDQNGPSTDEPAALLESGVTVGQVDISGLDLVLVAEGGSEAKDGDPIDPDAVPILGEIPAEGEPVMGEIPAGPPVPEGVPNPAPPEGEGVLAAPPADGAPAPAPAAGEPAVQG